MHVNEFTISSKYEFNREANTVCSKANDVEVTKVALLLKCEIEKIREQIQNIE